MKHMIQKATVVLGVALIAFSACKKDAVQTVTSTDDMVTLANQAESDMDNVAVYSNNDNGDIYMDDEGIAADFQVEANDCDLVQGAAGGTTSPDDSIRARIREHSFVRCLNGINLRDGQKDSIKAALKDYADCKADAVKRARAIYHELEKVYKGKAQDLLAAFKAGKITKAQLEDKMKDLRVAFHKELRAKHLAEKLDAAMANCYKEYLRKLHNILSERQWKAFVACHKK